MRTPCERIIWEVIPAIRREMACILVKEFSLSQKEVAKLLGITEAAISLYLHQKRGKKAKLNERVKRRLRKIAKEMVQKKSSVPLVKNTCTLCKMILRNDWFNK